MVAPRDLQSVAGVCCSGPGAKAIAAFPAAEGTALVSRSVVVHLNVQSDRPEHYFAETLEIAKQSAL